MRNAARSLLEASQSSDGFAASTSPPSSLTCVSERSICRRQAGVPVCQEALEPRHLRRVWRQAQRRECSGIVEGVVAGLHAHAAIGTNQV
eukprot:365949-Chlamydomonas_euryale.AAC.12